MENFSCANFRMAPASGEMIFHFSRTPLLVEPSTTLAGVQTLQLQRCAVLLSVV